ncbi:unnamed protein product, partial [Mesorhabditis spiculigera]
MTRKEVEAAHFTPRDYQLELLDVAQKQNSIIQLGTGTGKTFVAILLIKEYGLQTAAPLDRGGKRIFFLVDKVSLVEQQSAQIAMHTSFTVGKLHGALHVEYHSSKEKFREFLEKNHIIVLTAQVFLDLMNHAFYDPDQTALLIFDECHHAMGKGHPYRQIMERVRHISDRFRVLGLTASLINAQTKPALLEQEIRKLESALNARVATSSNMTSKYGAKPEEYLSTAYDYEYRKGLNKNVVDILEQQRLFVNNTLTFHEDFDYDRRKVIHEAFNRTLAVLRQCGPWCGWKVAQLMEKQMIAELKQPVLPDKTRDFLRLAESSMQTIKRILDPQMRPLKTFAAFEPYLPHKVYKLVEIFVDFEKKDELSAIVLVQQRTVAYALMILLKNLAKHDKDLAYLKPDYIIGQACGKGFANEEESMALHKRQQDCLRKFHKGELNIIVATNVLEEGIDVRQCNLVIKFDRPVDFRSYVQSKGRARKPGSKYVMLCEVSEKPKLQADIEQYQEIEAILLARQSNPHNPLDNDSLPEDLDSFMAPYVVPSTNARVTLRTAVSLVNRYCSSLPSDIFTKLVPDSKLLRNPNGSPTFAAELYLPMNSLLKEAVRTPEYYPSAKVAQMIVALEACIQLHKKGELNDHLLPQGKDAVAKLMSQLDEAPDEYMPPGARANLGSSKRRQLYDKKIAKALNKALPVKGQETYIYVFEMEVLKEPSQDSNPKGRKFPNPQQTLSCFGFLSAVILPPIPPFPAYLRQGDMRVYVRRAAKSIKLETHTMQVLAQFHHYLFSNVLLHNKDNLVFSLSEMTGMNTLVVPLNRVRQPGGIADYEINMKYVKELVQCMEELPRVPSEEQRKNYKFRKEDYVDTVVMPWYRSTEQPSFFQVAEVLENMNPSCAFPDTNFTSFNEYFDKKYNIKIYDQQQALLDVDYTSSRLNLLLPRNRSCKRVVRNSDPSQRQILVPELMDRHPIAAHLWNMICALPCFFYRINQMLLADELRERICVEALGSSEKIPEDFHWAPLSYPSTYEEKQSLTVSKIQQLRSENSQATSQTTLPSFSSGGSSFFEIGVWNPSLADGLNWKPTDLVGGVAGLQKNGSDLDVETVGLMKPTSATSGDLSDDDDADDLNILVDMSNKFTVKPESKDMVFANPRPEVLASLGGGDWDNWGVPLASSNFDSTFQILQGPGVDLNGLFADVQKMIEETPVLPAEASASSEPDSEVRRDKRIPNKAEKKPEDLIDSELREDGEEKRSVEETIDLVSLDDAPDEDQSRPASGSLVEQLDELRASEERKAKVEANILRVVAPNMSLKEYHLHHPVSAGSFSFADASPSTSRSVRGESISEAEDSFSATSQDYSSESHLAGRPWPQPSEDDGRYGVSPCFLLQALTTSNANDGINLERLETIGDSFLKYSVTDYLYHMHADQHEGKLSFARSKEVSNFKLYRHGINKGLPSLIVGYKFDVQDSWLPPCYMPNSDFKAPNCASSVQEDMIMESALQGELEEGPQPVRPQTGWDLDADKDPLATKVIDGVEVTNFPKMNANAAYLNELPALPYNMLTQQMISDKSIADSIEALIGAHLLSIGPEKTLKVMKWLGIKVLTEPAILQPPLLRFIDTPEDPNRSQSQLANYWVRYQLGEVEKRIGYEFKEKAYLLQAFTHASFYRNRITGCYQRLEFLGDAVLDYMITRYLYEHDRQYSPGVLTDLRSALVNNTIFASLAVKYSFHKHFLVVCPRLHFMVEKFVKLCEEMSNCANFNAEMYMITTEDECDEGQEEDVEVPKAMSDIFESVAGAIYLDSGCDLDVVWRVFYALMKETIDECCKNPPRSPIRELLELEPGTTRFSKMERIIETGKARVTVDVQRNGNALRFTGMGRNYRIAKTTAAKRALKYLHDLEQQTRRRAEKSDSID